MSNTGIILFDGICNLCNSSVRYVFKHDPKGLFKYAWLQSGPGRELLARFDLSKGDMNSFVLIENDKAYTMSTAALRVARKLKGPVKLLYGFIIVPRFIRDRVYRFIAGNRYRWFGNTNACSMPPGAIKERFLN